jgi:6,7-dimethyl-8-ribityllumazine synthase|tara:strand:+ start:1830 stop:2276 length:447 start_codon:yes stop_codon:yes gene_type:complete
MKLSKSQPELGVLDKDPSKIKIALVKAKFNYDITEEMETVAIKRLKELGVKNISSYEVPGSFEIPYACKKISKNYDAIIAIGCIIEGETDHYKFISENSSIGIQKVSIEEEKPIIFAVLTVKNHDQATERIKNAITYAENAVEMACNF